MKKCLIRVDSNPLIGTGHLMRCLAIAKQLARKCAIVFILADHSGTELLKMEKVFYRCLESQWNNMEDELEKLKKVIQEENANILLIDSYQVTWHYLECVKKIVKTVYIDDLHKFAYPCNILINYAVYAMNCDYKRIYTGPVPKLLLGCSYTPLRKEFCGLPSKKIRKHVSNILVLTGGTDVHHFALDFVKKIAVCKKWKNVEFHIVCGMYNNDIEELQAQEKKWRNIHVYRKISNLGRYMQQADIAVSAGGTTLYELAACGTPTIAYALADNQRENLMTFAKKRYLFSVGDIRAGFPEKELFNTLEHLKDITLRSKLSDKMQQLVDGKGCQRLAAELLK